MLTLGLDEAGRGCVLGPLVIGGYLVSDVRLAELSALGAADSKSLTPARREAARGRLAEVGTEWCAMVEPQQIDSGNLNALEEDAIVRCILELRPDRVIIDALGHPRALPAIVARLRERAGYQLDVLMEPKADVNHPVVGAASLIAKTTRDARLASDTVSFGDVGSGYPSDPRTRRWLEARHQSGLGWPAFVRTRWGTVRDLEAALPF
jgi:ribonuclease HII